jgi:hypothetical protein
MTRERLHPDDLQALAVLVAEEVVARLRDAEPVESSQTLLTAAEVAERFSVARGWVYENADALGAVRIGGGSRPRVRFEPERVRAALTRRLDSGESEAADEPVAAPNRGGPVIPSPGSALDPLPVRELQPRRSTSRKVAGRRANAPGPAPRDVSSAQREPTPDGSVSAGRVRAPRQEA